MRVFLSSTFADMQDERDYLVKHTFPALKRMCAARGVDFTVVDLRWGITEEESQQGKVLEICLDEVDRTRPFFIGLLGGRYGWIPEEGLSEAVKAKFPWVADDMAARRSITDMEMQYGVLRSPEKINAAFFMRRPEATPQEYTDPDGSEGHQKLTRLKENIAQAAENGQCAAADFATPEELGDKIYKVLSEIIDREHPASEDEDEIDRMYRYQRTVLEDMRRTYVDIGALRDFASEIDRCMDQRKGETALMFLTGEASSGKTAAIANWMPEGEYRGLPVLRTFLNSEFVSVRLAELFLLEQLYDGYGIEEDERDYEFDDINDVLEKFDINQPFIWLIDGVEAFDVNDEEKELKWLGRLPKKAHVLVCFRSESISTLLSFSNMQDSVINMPLLPPGAIISLTEEYLKKHSKSLNARLRVHIAHHGLFKHPIYLKLFLEELLQFGVFEDLDDFIDELIEAKTAEQFFRKIIGRMCVDYPADAVRRVLSVLALSVTGMPESSLQAITELNAIEWSAMYSALLPLTAEAPRGCRLVNEVAVKVVRGMILEANPELEPRMRTFIVNDYLEIPDEDDFAATRFDELIPQYVALGRWADVNDMLTSDFTGILYLVEKGMDVKTDIFISLYAAGYTPVSDMMASMLDMFSNDPEGYANLKDNAEFYNGIMLSYLPLIPQGQIVHETERCAELMRNAGQPHELVEAVVEGMHNAIRIQKNGGIGLEAAVEDSWSLDAEPDIMQTALLLNAIPTLLDTRRVEHIMERAEVCLSGTFMGQAIIYLCLMRLRRFEEADAHYDKMSGLYETSCRIFYLMVNVYGCLLACRPVSEDVWRQYMEVVGHVEFHKDILDMVAYLLAQQDLMRQKSGQPDEEIEADIDNLIKHSSGPVNMCKSLYAWFAVLDWHIHRRMILPCLIEFTDSPEMKFNGLYELAGITEEPEEAIQLYERAADVLAQQSMTEENQNRMAVALVNAENVFQTVKSSYELGKKYMSRYSEYPLIMANLASRQSYALRQMAEHNIGGESERWLNEAVERSAQAVEIALEKIPEQLPAYLSQYYSNLLQIGRLLTEDGALTVECAEYLDAYRNALLHTENVSYDMRTLGCRVFEVLGDFSTVCAIAGNEIDTPAVWSSRLRVGDTAMKVQAYNHYRDMINGHVSALRGKENFAPVAKSVNEIIRVMDAYDMFAHLPVIYAPADAAAPGDLVITAFSRIALRDKGADDPCMQVMGLLAARGDYRMLFLIAAADELLLPQESRDIEVTVDVLVKDAINNAADADSIDMPLLMEMIECYCTIPNNMNPQEMARVVASDMALILRRRSDAMVHVAPVVEMLLRLPLHLNAELFYPLLNLEPVLSEYLTGDDSDRSSRLAERISLSCRLGDDDVDAAIKDSALYAAVKARIEATEIVYPDPDAEDIDHELEVWRQSRSRCSGDELYDLDSTMAYVLELRNYLDEAIDIMLPYVDGEHAASAYAALAVYYFRAGYFDRIADFMSDEKVTDVALDENNSYDDIVSFAFSVCRYFLYTDDPMNAVKGLFALEETLGSFDDFPEYALEAAHLRSLAMLQLGLAEDAASVFHEYENPEEHEIPGNIILERFIAYARYHQRNGNTEAYHKLRDAAQSVVDETTWPVLARMAREL